MPHCIWAQCRSPREARILEAFCLAGQISDDQAPLPCRISLASDQSLDIDPQGHPVSTERLRNLYYVTATGEFDTDDPLPGIEPAFAGLLNWLAQEIPNTPP